MFEALGRFSYRFRWLVIGLWLVLFAFSIVSLPFLGNVLTGSFGNPNSPSQQTDRLIQQKFQQGPTRLLIVFKSDTLDATSEEFQQAEKKALEGLAAAGIPYLQSIQTYADTGSAQLISKDKKSSVAVLTFDAPLITVQKEIDTIRQALRDTVLKAYVTGEPAINADLTTYSFRDLRKVEIYGLPVALVALLFVFGSLVSAALPVITGGVAVTVTLGAMYLVGRATHMSIFSMNTASLLGLAVAIDYGLFIVWRFREELHRGASVREAVIVTSARAGRSVFFSGAAVLVGVVGLLFFPSPGLRSIGTGGALVVFFSVAASVTFMPALLGVIGRKVDSLPVIRLHAAHEGRLLSWWSRVVLKRPWAAIVGAAVIIALLVAPAFLMKFQMTTPSTLPPSAESRQGIEILDREFDREALSPISVLVTWEGDGLDVVKAGSLFMYAQQLASTQGVKSVLSPFTVGGMSDPMALVSLWPQFELLFNNPDAFVVPQEGITLDSGITITASQLEQFKRLVKSTIAPDGALFYVVSQDPASSGEARALVERIWNLQPPAGFTVHVTGEAAYSYDFFKEVSDWFPWVFLWVVLTSLLVFVLLLRSMVLPVLAVGVNLLTIGMSYGCLVLLFQGNTFERILRITSTGAIDIVIPVVLLCVLFGITMDYAVFMLTRMHERWYRTGDNHESLVTGLVRGGRIVVSAALLVVIVTGAFAFTNIAETKMLGLGIALAIIVDTVLIRLTLLPAVMKYLGRANWWWPSLNQRKTR